MKLVVLIYEDDSVLYMPDQEAQEWMDKANAAVVCADLRNMNPFKNRPIKTDRITIQELRKNLHTLQHAGNMGKKKYATNVSAEKKKDFLRKHYDLALHAFPVHFKHPGIQAIMLAEKAREELNYSKNSWNRDILRPMERLWAEILIEGMQHNP